MFRQRCLKVVAIILVVVVKLEISIRIGIFKVELNPAKYHFVLEQDEKKFNGEPPRGYMIISNAGNKQKIWDVKKDGPMPLIFTAKNVHGLYVNEDYK